MSNVLSEEKKQQVLAHWDGLDGRCGALSRPRVCAEKPQALT
jgi:hypothetical protein